MNGTGFTLDLGRCVGCGTCVLACRLANDWPAGVAWRRILPLNLDRKGGGPTYHFSLACHHCERPACLAACPAGAYEKCADGVVRLDPSRCIGCRYCEMACPFGAPSYNRAEGVMTKCHLCPDRRAADQLPACVSACPTEALRFSRQGDDRIPFHVAESIPGFCDPAGCAPNLSFIRPRGMKRARLFGRLQEALSER